MSYIRKHKRESRSGKIHKEKIAVNVYEPLLYFNVNIRPWAPSAPKENEWNRGSPGIFFPNWKFSGSIISSISH